MELDKIFLPFWHRFKGILSPDLKIKLKEIDRFNGKMDIFNGKIRHVKILNIFTNTKHKSPWV